MVRMVTGTDSMRWLWSCRSLQFLVFSLRSSLRYPGASLFNALYTEKRFEDDTVADREPVQGFHHRGDISNAFNESVLD